MIQIPLTKNVTYIDRPWISSYKTCSYLIENTLTQTTILIDPDDQIISECLFDKKTIIIFSHDHKTISEYSTQLAVKKGSTIIRESNSENFKNLLSENQIEIYPFPGHTDDSIIIKYNELEDHLWFTGDSFYPNKENNNFNRPVYYSKDNNLLDQEIEKLKTYNPPKWVCGSITENKGFMEIEKKKWISYLENAKAYNQMRKPQKNV